MEQEIRKIVRDVIKEYVSRKDLRDIENYADSLFSDIGVDVELSSHFADRVNDPRNKKEIEPEELERTFEKTRFKHSNTITNMKDQEAVINDRSTDINIPIAVSKTVDGVKSLVGMTIMRKKDFLSSSPKLKV